mmetsp:Transcript_12427/g.25667  ORF Transcript_12427/g.25667 Transcript_12427/m.25667 type:complete len:193 (+) Transcript_12427:210-788(+)
MGQSHNAIISWPRGKAHALSRNAAVGGNVRNDVGVDTSQAQDAPYNEMLSSSRRGQQLVPIQRQHGLPTGFATLQQQQHQYQYGLVGATPVGFRGIGQDLMPRMPSLEAHLNRQMQLQQAKVQQQKQQVQQQKQQLQQLQLRVIQGAGSTAADIFAAMPSELGGAMRQHPQLQDRMAMIPPSSLRHAMGGDG